MLSRPLSETEAVIMKRDLVTQSLYWFAKLICGYSQLEVDTHGHIIESLESEHKRKLICVPRGCFKSSIASVAFPIWLLIRNPNLRILIDSELYTNSKNFLREIKAHMRSEQFIELFGNWEGDTWNEGEIVIKPRTKALKEASISCAGIGAEKTSQHYDIICGDDLSSTQNVMTPELAQKTINHYRLYTSLLEPNGTIVVIGTRYSENDIIGWILREQLGIKTQEELNTAMGC